MQITEIHEKVQVMFPSPIYLVGGAVRDQLLGREVNDLDFSTALIPDEIEACIKRSGRRAYLVGKRFGTIGVKIDGQMVEITTFRGEKYTSGSRKPQVEFVDDLHLDLSRRDFTINAIAKTVDGKYVDPFSGRIDILQNTIKTVGKAKDRFKDDPLRILRAARFVSQLHFNIDQMTAGYMRKMAASILNVSKERWCQEIDKLLMGDSAGHGLDVLMDTRLINFMIPELALQKDYDQNSPYHRYNLWDHTVLVVDFSPREINMRWAALLHDIGKPFTRTEAKAGHSNYIDHQILGAEIVEKIALYLKWSNDRRQQVKDLVLHHLEGNSPLKEIDDKAK